MFHFSSSPFKFLHFCQGSSISAQKPSLQIGFFAVLFLGMMILIVYRAQLNAALNVRILKIPTTSWEDVLQSDKNLMIWRGSSIEAIFKNSPSGE